MLKVGFLLHSSFGHGLHFMTSGGRARHRKKGEGAKQAARIAATFLITTFLPAGRPPTFPQKTIKAHSRIWSGYNMRKQGRESDMTAVCCCEKCFSEAAAASPRRRRRKYQNTLITARSVPVSLLGIANWPISGEIVVRPCSGGGSKFRRSQLLEYYC